MRRGVGEAGDLGARGSPMSTARGSVLRANDAGTRTTIVQASFIASKPHFYFWRQNPASPLPRGRRPSNPHPHLLASPPRLVRIDKDQTKKDRTLQSKEIGTHERSCR